MKITRARFLAGLTGFTAAALSGCSSGGDASPAPDIVTTTTMVTDLVRALAGDTLVVQALMGPGVDPHLFKPGQDDIQKLQKATVIFYSGLHLEGKMAEIFERLQHQGRKVYALADGLQPADIITAEGQPDPHIWGDLSNWIKCLAFCASKLKEVYPDKAAAIDSRALSLTQELTATHQRLQARADTLPKEKRILVTSHDAFRYFGRAYGFEVIGIQGISTASEAAQADMARIVDRVKSAGVKAVFVESSVSHATIERISKDTGAKIGGELFSDALGAPGELRDTGSGGKVDTSTVAGMLQANMHTIVEALR